MKKIILLILSAIYWLGLTAQDSTGTLGFSAYTEPYYQYDFNKPVHKERPWFLYNFKKHHEFNINLAYIKAAWSGKRTRANFALMTGTYPLYNLSSEPSTFQYVLEANAGYLISEKWSFDAGVLPSHIGMESAVSRDCWNLSRSIMAENSPYYETGLKFNFTPSQKWNSSILLLNGWQLISDNNKHLAMGGQIQFMPKKGWLFNYSSFAGNENPDSISGPCRFFHNFYFYGSLHPKLNLAFLFDLGSVGKKSWYGTAFLLQYHPRESFRLAFRMENYRDEHSQIIKSPVPGGFYVHGFSLNGDFIPVRNLSLRIELRYLHAKTALFETNTGYSRKNLAVLCSMAFSI